MILDTLLIWSDICPVNGCNTFFFSLKFEEEDKVAIRFMIRWFS